MTKMKSDETPTCPVEAYARRLNLVNAALKSMDEEKAEGYEHDRFEQELEDTRDALETMIGLERATSAAGAMAQTMLALSDLDSVIANLKAPKPRDVSGERRRMERCLRSVLSYIEHQSGISRAELSGDYYATAERDWAARLSEMIEPEFSAPVTDQDEAA